MKKLLLLLLVATPFLMAQNTAATTSQKQLQKQMEKEKKYAKEGKFYQAKDYDFKSMQVDPESLKSIKSIETDDMDMDDVYD
jgi:sortase (surface protein transpeptidase)